MRKRYALYQGKNISLTIPLTPYLEKFRLSALTKGEFTKYNLTASAPN